MANAYIYIYENGEERSLDTFNSSEIHSVLEEMVKLTDNKYVIDLFSGYIYDVDYEFILKFGTHNDKYLLQTKIGNFEVAFEIQEDDDDDSEDSYS